MTKDGNIPYPISSLTTDNARQPTIGSKSPN
jgi:hypothetical protein